jgi:hypothetical protein
MKMKISKGGTEKNTQKRPPCPYAKMKKFKKGDGQKKKNILSLYENENLKRGGQKKNTPKTKT